MLRAARTRVETTYVANLAACSVCVCVFEREGESPARAWRPCMSRTWLPVQGYLAHKKQPTPLGPP